MRTIGSALVSIALLFFAACGGDDHQVPSPNASNLSGEEASISFCLQLQSGGTDQSNANLVDLGSTWENRIKLFRKFQRLESPEAQESGGTGLGLAICKEIIERHHGKIFYQPGESGGNIFSFSVPVIGESA